MVSGAQLPGVHLASPRPGAAFDIAYKNPLRPPPPRSQTAPLLPSPGKSNLSSVFTRALHDARSASPPSQSSHCIPAPRPTLSTTPLRPPNLALAAISRRARWGLVLHLAASSPSRGADFAG